MMRLALAVLALPLSLALPNMSVAMTTMQGKLTVTKMADGFEEPWAIGHLPDGGLIVTERPGRVVHIADTGERFVLSGLSGVVAGGQGGLLDVMVPRDFAETRELYFSYSARHDKQGGTGTALGRAVLSADGTSLEGFEKLFQIAPHPETGSHFGSRVVEGVDGTIFMTVGDRGTRELSQELGNHNGTVVRLNRDGSVPEDNPFLGQAGVRPEIYSYGHRNPQGAALAADGTLWVAEHGARGGDEVNRIKPGANYGWPVISYGTHYSGERIGLGTRQPGMEQPLHYWDPSMAPSGMMIYSGKLWPAWEGDIFVGSLKFDYISRLEGPNVFEREKLASPETGRVRDVVEGPDGAIWFLSVYDGAVYKITP